MPFGVKVAAAWALVVALIVGVTLGIGLLLAQIRPVVFALVSALLQPLVARLRAAGVPRVFAATLVFVGFLAAVVVTLWLVGRRVADEFDDLGKRLVEGLEEVRDSISDALPLSAERLDRLADQAGEALEDGADGLAGSVPAALGTAGEVAAGVVLALFITFFMLAAGSRMWEWVVTCVPREARSVVRPAGERGWTAIVSYMRSIVVAAFTDALLIAIALWILGVPLVLPLAVLGERHQS